MWLLLAALLEAAAALVEAAMAAATALLFRWLLLDCALAPLHSLRVVRLTFS